MSASPVSASLVQVRTLLSRSAAARYGCAFGLVAAAFAARALLDPALSPGHIYLCFYPAVILSAHLVGARPAAAAAALSAALGYWFFSLPAFAVKTEFAAYVPLLFFAVSSALAIYVLSHVRGSLLFLGESLGRTEALTRCQADLFREHAERVSNHLQVVAALLQLHGRYESDAAASKVLNNAASRTLLISRMHRDFSGQPERVIDFEAFAWRLSEAAVSAKGARSLRVSIEGDGLQLPLEQAAGLGVVLLECIDAASRRPGALTVSLCEIRGEAVFRVVEPGGGGPVRPRDPGLLEAMADQLGGRLHLSADALGFALQLVFPRELQPLPRWEPLGAAVH